MRRTDILTVEEAAMVLDYLEDRPGPTAIIFRLSCCCGLRRSEISGLNMGDMSFGGKRPYIKIRKEIGKGGKARHVPLWWDEGTLTDLQVWSIERRMDGATNADPFVVSDKSDYFGARIHPKNIADRWSRLILRAVGRHLSVHCGRHSFISHAISAGRSIPEVRDAAGHASIGTTEQYTHMIETPNVPSVFGRERLGRGK